MSLKNSDEILAQAIGEYEKSIVKIILLCVDNLEFGLGATKLAQLLKGTQTRFITEYGLQNNKAFSLLKQFSKNDIKFILNMLEELQYLELKEVKNGLNTVYKIGIKGYAFLEEDLTLDFSFIDAITESNFVELDVEELARYEELRKLRWVIAQENDFAAYMVCGELSLRIMARDLPQTEEDFLEIKGIGPVFINNYYNRFAEITRKYR
jgi:ATP-dependent DNA helicase RecQ